MWNVGRRVRWPRWRRLPKGRGGDFFDPLNVIDVPASTDNLIGAIIVLAVVVVVLGLLIFLFLPLVLFVLEAAAVVVAAVALGRPWLVVASTGGPPAEERRWLVRGFRGSRAAVREVADELGYGVPAQPEDFEQERVAPYAQ